MSILELIRANDVDALKKVLSESPSPLELVNHVDEEGWTSLMYACLYGHLEIVQLLIQVGADIHFTNFKRINAFRIAKRYKFKEILNILKPKSDLTTPVNPAKYKRRLGDFLKKCRILNGLEFNEVVRQYYFLDDESIDNKRLYAIEYGTALFTQREWFILCSIYKIPLFGAYIVQKNINWDLTFDVRTHFEKAVETDEIKNLLNNFLWSMEHDNN